MIGKILLLALCGATLAQESGNEINSEVDVVRTLTEEGKKRVEETYGKVRKAPLEFDEITEDRLCSVLWEYVVQKTATNKTVSETVFKGMLKNKLFSSFQCISIKSQAVFKTLDEINSTILETSRNIKEKRLIQIQPFARIIPGLYDYVQDLGERKTNDLNKTQKPEERKKIVAEVVGKIKLLKSILDKVDDQIKSIKFEFLEEHIGFLFKVEKNLKEVGRRGSEAIRKCVA